MGFFYGMLLPVALMQASGQVIAADSSIAWTLLILIGSPFICMLLAMWLFRWGVQQFGRPTMSLVGSAMFLLAFAAVGHFSVTVLLGGGTAAGIAFALLLVIPNVLLFYTRRDYLYGEDAEAEQANSKQHDPGSRDNATSRNDRELI